MGLHGKLVAAVEFKAGGDLYHELFKQKPHFVSTTCPEKVQGCDLLEGEFGKVGSKICWRYTHEGKEKICKEVVQLIDDENKMIQLKMYEGDMFEEYKLKDLVITIHVETKDGIDLATWIMEYEMLDNEEGEHPLPMLAYFLKITKDIEAHHL